MSSGLLFFTSEDFRTEKGPKGKVLCINVKGLCLILFYSPMCKHCNNFLPDFKTLPGRIGGCQFGMVNVNNSKEVVMMSAETIVPIKYVPYMILYEDGVPIIRYDGEHSSVSIVNFICDVNGKLNQRRATNKSSNEQNRKQEHHDELVEVNGFQLKVSTKTISKYCDGRKKRENITYLTFMKAYTGNKNGNRKQG